MAQPSPASQPSASARQRPPLKQVLRELARDRSLWVIVVLLGSLFLSSQLFGQWGVIAVVFALLLFMISYLICQIALAREEAAFREGYAQAKSDLAGTFVEPEEEPEEPVVKPRSRQRPSGLAERSLPLDSA